MECEFTNTYTGKCELTPLANSRYCYYHNKVSLGLIEADPLLALRQAQTIAKD